MAEKGHEFLARIGKTRLRPGGVVATDWLLEKGNIKADNNHKYRCLRLTYYEYEDDKWREIANFYVTDDSNHIPVRLDMSLKFGSAKAFLVSMKGINSPITSEIK